MEGGDINGNFYGLYIYMGYTMLYMEYPQYQSAISWIVTNSVVTHGMVNGMINGDESG